MPDEGVSTDKLAIGLGKVHEGIGTGVAEGSTARLNGIPLHGVLYVPLMSCHLKDVTSHQPGVNWPNSALMIAAFWALERRVASEHVPKYFFPLATNLALRPPDGEVVGVTPPPLLEVVLVGEEPG